MRGLRLDVPVGRAVCPLSVDRLYGADFMSDVCRMRAASSKNKGGESDMGGRLGLNLVRVNEL